MDELKKLNCSCHSHKGHLGKLLSATEEVLRKLSSLRETNPDATLSEPDILILTEQQKQLCLKAETFQDIDDKIIAITDDEEKLEAALYEAADLQEVLSEKMALITYTLAACTSSQSSVTASSTINTRASSVPPQPLTDGSEIHVSGTDKIMHPPAAEPISTVESATAPPLSANTHMHTPHKEPMHAHHFGTHLPKLEIPVFTGDPLGWQPFWDCFEATIDTNPILIGVQKLSYLRAQLHGEASRVITGLPLHLLLIMCMSFFPMQVLDPHLQHSDNPSGYRPAVNMSTNCYVNVWSLVDIVVDHTPSQNHLHFQRLESRMYHLSPSLVWIFYVKQNSEEVKVYLCLFTCATSRAVHLEVVTHLSTATFLLAFRRFTSRRSLPVVMMSDNASTYTSAADKLTRLFTSEELNTGVSTHELEIGCD